MICKCKEKMKKVLYTYLGTKVFYCEVCGRLIIEDEFDTLHWKHNNIED